MEESTGAELAVKLATEVLKRKMSFDEGLIYAQTNHSLEQFIDGLNVLVGRELFNLAAAQQRLRTGSAERATKGEEALMELPPELNGWTLEGEHTKPPIDEKVFAPWNQQASKYESEVEEIQLQLQMLEKYLAQPQTISPPWLAPATLLALTLIVTLVARFILHSVIGSGVVLVVGSFLCLSVFQKEFKRYEAESRKIQIENKKRLQKRTKLMNELEDCKKRIQDLRNKAQEVLESSAPASEEKMSEIRAEFSHLFPPE